MRATLATIIVCAGLIATSARAALIPPFFINAVAALGDDLPVPAAPGQPPKVEWRTLGTGFFYGFLIQNDADPKKRLYSVFLVTAKHVVEDYLALQKQTNGSSGLEVRLNPITTTSPAQQFLIPSNPEQKQFTWFFNPNPDLDVAIVQVNLNILKPMGIEPSFFPDDAAVADKAKMQQLGVSAGDGVFVLGFPMNLAGSQRNYAIIREGGIARITEMLDDASSTFMIDSFVFPGNSGSPVVLRPEITAIQGTKSVNAAYLIGMVLAYLPYTDVAVSQQTHRPRIAFEENSGLAEVLPIDYVRETIEMWQKAHPSAK
jgi:hypothetical protein